MGKIPVTLKEVAKRMVYPLVDVFRIFSGYAYFLIFGRTPARAYQSVIRLFCSTQGRSSDFLSGLLARFHPPYRLSGSSGVLGDLTAEDVRKITDEIKKKGYYVFKTRLDDELCRELFEFARKTPCRVIPSDAEAEAGRPATAVITRYSPEDPIGIRYDIPTQSVLDHPTVQKLISDLSVLSVAQSYIGSAPILDIATMWWNTAFGGKPSKQAAQYYHFDMDRLRWLKFFFYLTDVTEDSGPHCFVARSHRRSGIAPELLKKGYSRLTDEEVASHFPDPEDFVVFTGKKGTILAEDTRGLHKGKNVARGDRLVFQLEFTNSLFGGRLEDCRLDKIREPKLAEMVRKYPRIYSAFPGGRSPI